MSQDKILSATASVCPQCLARIPALRVARGKEVFLQKTCPQHGAFETVIWRGPPYYADWEAIRLPAASQADLTPVDKGCPWDCGLCSRHLQQTCTALMEVTQRCNLGCAFCFADAQHQAGPDPGMDEIRAWYEMLLESGGPYNVQISGGEPTLRQDLPEIIALGRSMGFEFIQLNTNGLRLGREVGYLKELKDAGLASVFLQFDGVDDQVYRAMSGHHLFEIKMNALHSCAQNQLAAILVPRLVPGLNTHQVGALIDLALLHLPTVRGVHFQPVSFFGRYPATPAEADRLTIPEIIRAIEKQTQGRISVLQFRPPTCENAYCSFQGSFVLMPGGEIKAWASPQVVKCCPEPRQPALEATKSRRFVANFWSAAGQQEVTQSLGCAGLGGWEVFAQRVRSHTLSISGMAFQDAWNLDLQRLRECCIHVVNPAGGLVPFCAYNLTDQRGRSCYRHPVGTDELGLGRLVPF